MNYLPGNAPWAFSPLSARGRGFVGKILILDSDSPFLPPFLSFSVICVPRSFLLPSSRLLAYSLSSCFSRLHPSSSLLLHSTIFLVFPLAPALPFLPSLPPPSVCVFLPASHKLQKTSRKLFQQSISFCCCCRRVVMHRAAGRPQQGGDHSLPSTEPAPAAALPSPRRCPRHSTPEYKPRSEYKDAYRAYSPSTIKRIYQENKKARMRYQKRDREGTKEYKDLLPTVSKPRVPPPRPAKPQPRPQQKVPQKKIKKKAIPAPCTCQSPVHSSSSDVSCVSAPTSGCMGEAPPRPLDKVPLFHPCTDITWYIPEHRKGTKRVVRAP